MKAHRLPTLLAGACLAALLLGCTPAPIRPVTSETQRVAVPTAHTPPDARSALERIEEAIAPAAPGPSADVNLKRNQPTASAVFARLSTQLDAPRCSRSQTRRSMTALLRQPDAFASKVERVLPMLDYVLTALEQRDLPGQFALIPWAESGFRADPGNRGTVQGMWQFTESTGRAHGLRIDQRYDGRRAAIESTAAAIDHLDTLQRRFGDWRLSILAYNVGEYGLARALRQRSAGSGAIPRGLPAHSYIYLQKINALACILAKPDAHGLVLSSDPFDRMQEVERPRDLHSTAQLARAAGIELQELLRYNAGFRDGDIADRTPPLILLPGQTAVRLVGQNSVVADLTPQSPARHAGGPTAAAPHPPLHTVSGGETLWRIARRYRLALHDLLGWNGLSAGSVIRPGQQLRIARP